LDEKEAGSMAASRWSG